MKSCSNDPVKFVRFVFAPLLVLALVLTSLYVGLARPGAGKALTLKLLSSEQVRADMATSLVDQLVDSDDLLLKALLLNNRDKAESTIAQSLATEQEQREISDAVETLINALFTGKKTVEVDPTPIYRPIYDALDAIFPTLKLGETGMKDIEPITLGSDSPLPDLAWLRSMLTASLALWPLLFLLGYLYIRRYGRRGAVTLSVQTAVVGSVAILVTLIAPVLLKSLASDPLLQTVTGTAISQLGFAALLISLILTIAAIVTLLLARRLARKSVVASQSTTQSE